MLYKIINKEAVIGMPPGVGDLHWIMTKMESFKKENDIEKIKVMMNLPGTADDYYSYSIEYFDLLPFIDSAEQHMGALDFEYQISGGSGIPLFKGRNGCDYLIEFNSSLEKGVLLKDILPEYETNYDYPIEEPAEAKEYAKKLKAEIGEKLVLIFTSSLRGNEAWPRELWTVEDWTKLIRKIYHRTGCKLVLVGAKWDSDYAEALQEASFGEYKTHPASVLIKENMIHSMIGKTTLAQLFAILRESDLLITWQCGVGIMATQFRIPVASFWPIKNKANPRGQFERAFTRSWLPPWAEEVGYMPYGWGDKDATPSGIFNAVRKYL